MCEGGLHKRNEYQEVGIIGTILERVDHRVHLDTLDIASYCYPDFSNEIMEAQSGKAPYLESSS